jgi:hypothetical protein
MRGIRTAARAEQEKAERRRLEERHRLRVAAANEEYEAGKRRQAKMLEELGLAQGGR